MIQKFRLSQIESHPVIKYFDGVRTTNLWTKRYKVGANQFQAGL